jgi:lipopolysaccharide transport system permease protein
MPISSAISQLINFAIQFVFMLGFLAYYLISGEGLNPNWLIVMTPLVLIQMAILGTGFGVIVSSMTTKYRDLQMVVGFGVSLWSYCSPVAYDMFSRSALMPGSRFYPLYMLNPVTPGINLFRYAFLGTGQIDWMYYGISWGVTLVVAVLAVRVFSKVEKTFIDTV